MWLPMTWPPEIRMKPSMKQKPAKVVVFRTDGTFAEPTYALNGAPRNVLPGERQLINFALS